MYPDDEEIETNLSNIATNRVLSMLQRDHLLVAITNKPQTQACDFIITGDLIRVCIEA